MAIDQLQVCAIITIVFCVSLISLFFINQRLRGGRSFEDVLAERRQLAHLVGGSRYATKKAKQQRTANGGTGGKKETKKERKAAREANANAHADEDSASESQSQASSKDDGDFSDSEQQAEEMLVAQIGNSKVSISNRY